MLGPMGTTAIQEFPNKPNGTATPNSKETQLDPNDDTSNNNKQLQNPTSFQPSKKPEEKDDIAIINIPKNGNIVAKSITYPFLLALCKFVLQSLFTPINHFISILFII